MEVDYGITSNLLNSDGKPFGLMVLYYNIFGKLDIENIK